MTFAQLFDEMRSRAHAAQSGTTNKRGASPLNGYVKNKSLSAATSVSGKTQDTECGHIDDVMSKRAKYECKDCYRSFSSASNLLRHERGHAGKMYACTRCNASFSRAQGLSEHMNIHEGIKPHACPACEKSFRTKSELFQHSQTHKDSRTYCCKICGQTFKQNSSLHQHMSVHSEQRRFVCQICGANFKRKDKLKQHQKRAGLAPDAPINLP
jgi:uncharacterized Zn-finger protein